jgi:peptide/nickel transport system substrate-binding protein
MWLLLAAVVVGAMPFTVGSASSGGPSVAPDTVVMIFQQEPSCLNPKGDACSMFVSSAIRALIFCCNNSNDGEPVLMTSEWKFLPAMVEKVPSRKDGDWKVNADGSMQVTWKLRKGFTWHDGKPVTAEDYIWAWRVEVHPDFPASDRSIAERVENIFAPDPYTLVVKWKKKYALANHYIAGSGILPKHVTERLFRANPAKFLEAWGTSVPTIGDGPYILKEWQKGSSMTLEANPAWPGVPGVLPEKPAVRRVVFRFITDTNTIIANVLSGAADGVDETAIPFVQGLELEQRLKNEGRTDIVLKSEPGLIWEHIDMNVDNVHLKDKRVRQALIYAINREELVQQLFQGKQPVSHTFLPDKHYGYNKNAKKYAYDPARARALFGEAGYTAGSDGVLQKGGQRLSLTFVTTAGNRTRESVQQILQSQWKAVGVEVKIQNQPARSYFGDTLPTRKFELAMYAWVKSPDSDCESEMTSDHIPGGGQAGGQNYPGYRNAEVDRLCHAVPETLDEGERAEMLRQAQAIWAEDLPSIPLYLRADYTAHKAGLQNWLPTSSQVPITWNGGQWKWLR